MTSEERIDRLEKKVEELERKMRQVWVVSDQFYVIPSSGAIIDRKTGIRVGYR